MLAALAYPLYAVQNINKSYVEYMMCGFALFLAGQHTAMIWNVLIHVLVVLQNNTIKLQTKLFRKRRRANRNFVITFRMSINAIHLRCVCMAS